MLDQAANTIHVLGAVVALTREEREDETGSPVTDFSEHEIARASGVEGEDFVDALQWLADRGDVRVTATRAVRLQAKGLDAYRTLEAFDAIPARR